MVATVTMPLQWIYCIGSNLLRQLGFTLFISQKATNTNQVYSF